jgi:hypothetical protein
MFRFTAARTWHSYQLLVRYAMAGRRGASLDRRCSDIKAVFKALPHRLERSPDHRTTSTGHQPLDQLRSSHVTPGPAASPAGQ